MNWVKSGRSSGSGQCVEVTHVANQDTDMYLVRDSKDPDGPKLHFTRAEWEAFLGGAKDGDFDNV